MRAFCLNPMADLQISGSRGLFQGGRGHIRLYRLNSLKWVIYRDYIGEYYRVLKGDTRSLDYGSCRDM